MTMFPTHQVVTLARMHPENFKKAAKQDNNPLRVGLMIAHRLLKTDDHPMAAKELNSHFQIN